MPDNDVPAGPAGSASVAEFLGVLRANYVAAFGGGMSVLATLAAAFLPTIPSPWFVGITAVICGVLSAYAIWARERNARAEAERKLQPAFRFLPTAGATYMQMATADENATPTHDYHRLVVINVGTQPVHDVKVFVQKIDGSELPFSLELMPMDGHLNPTVTAFHDVPVAFDLVQRSYTEDYFNITGRHRFLPLVFGRHELELAIAGSEVGTMRQYVSLDGNRQNRLVVALLDKPSGTEQKIAPFAYSSRRAEDELEKENKRLRAELTAFQPRRLSESQKGELRSILEPLNLAALEVGSDKGRQITVFWTGAGDCADYARQFEDLFGDIGFRLHLYSMPSPYERDYHYGLWVIWNSEYEGKFAHSLGQALCDALRLAEIEFTSVDTTDVHAAQLVVGARRL